MENGKSVPMSASEVQEFFLRKNRMDKAWRQEQRDSIAFLHTYRNKNAAVVSSHRSSSSKREFPSQQVYSEMDSFYLQQRVMEKEWKRQQKDSMAYLHNYRNNTLVGGALKGGESNGNSTMVTPAGSSDYCDYDIYAAIAFHERQQLLEERLALAINCPLPPDSPELSSDVETIQPTEESSSPALDDSMTKLLEVAEHEPSSSSNTEEIYEDSTTSIEEDYREEEELEVVMPDTPTTDVDGQIEIFEDSVPSSEVNSVCAEPARQVEAVPISEGIGLGGGITDDVRGVEKSSDHEVDEDDDLLDELLADDMSSANAREEAHGDTGDELGADGELDPDTIEKVKQNEIDVDEDAKPADALDDEDNVIVDEMTYRTPEKEATNGLNEFNRLVEYMSPGINHDNAPDNLEELLQVEDENEALTSQAEGAPSTTKSIPTDEDDAASDAQVNATKDTVRKPSDVSPIPMSRIKSSKARATQLPQVPTTPPPRRRSNRTESKIVPPQKRISATDGPRETSDGKPHYMKPTLSTPERRSKVTPSFYSPQRHESPLYSRRETPESFKLKANKCTNKWIPSLHSSRGGCERCLHFADEDERLKFQRDGHYYRICLVRGGCARSCPCFPRRPEQPPVRLCRKCFYDTHRLGKM